jgi:hypothetical protein
MTTDPTIEQTRKLLAESRAVMERLRAMRDETHVRTCGKVINESLEALSHVQEKLASSPQSDTSGPSQSP